MPLRTDETPDRINVFFRGVRELNRAETIAVCERAEATGKMVFADLEEIPFLNSLMIGSVVLLHKETKKRHIALTVSGVSPDVMKVLKLSRLDKILDLDGLSDSDSQPEAED
jgi:anti-anti-sigma factor